MAKVRTFYAKKGPHSLSLTVQYSRFNFDSNFRYNFSRIWNRANLHFKHLPVDHKFRPWPKSQTEMPVLYQVKILVQWVLQIRDNSFFLENGFNKGIFALICHGSNKGMYKITHCTCTRCTLVCTLVCTYLVDSVRCRIAIFFACLMSILPRNCVSLSSCWKSLKTSISSCFFF